MPLPSDHAARQNRLQPNFKTYLTLNGETSSATSLTLGAAEAVVRSFEIEHAGNKEALAEIRELDGSILGTRVYSWAGYYRVGPKDTRHPMQKLMQRAVRSGARVTISDGCDTWRFNHDFAPVRAGLCKGAAA